MAPSGRLLVSAKIVRDGLATFTADLSALYRSLVKSRTKIEIAVHLAVILPVFWLITVGASAQSRRIDIKCQDEQQVIFQQPSGERAVL